MVTPLSQMARVRVSVPFAGSSGGVRERQVARADGILTWGRAGCMARGFPMAGGAKKRKGPPVLERAGQFAVYAAFRVFEGVLRVLPLSVVFLLGRLGGLVVWAMVPGYRRLVAANLRIAFGREMSPAERAALGREHFQTLGANLLSSLKIPTMPLEKINAAVEIDGIEHVERAIRAGRGFAYAICHMGNWEVLSQIPKICPGGKPGTLFQPLGNPWMNAHVARLRGRFGFRLFDRHDGFVAAVSFLREGGGLGVLVDQHAGDGGIWCPLFGRLASTTNLAALLTLRTRGPVLPLGMATVGRAKWKIFVQPPVEAASGNAAAHTAQLNLELERIIRRSPADWFWVHNRWKTPRPNFLLANYKRGVELPEGMSTADLQRFEILVRTPNWLGDACMALPAVRAIKRGRPDARVTVLTPAKLADFWRAVPEVDAIIEKGADDGVLAVRAAVKKTGVAYDAAVLLVESPRSAFEVAGCGIPRVVGYRGRWRKWFVNQVVPKAPPAPLRHHVQHFLRIAETLGAAVDDPALLAPLRPRVGREPGETARISLCAGAEYGPAKRFPLDRFAAVAREVSATLACEWTLVGAPSEVAMGEELEGSMGQNCRNLVGKTTLPGLMDVLATSDLLLTNDTGTMHLAAALGVPVVAIFGSTEPAWTGPLGEGHTVVRRHVECSPCFRRECPRTTDRYRCFGEISEARVIETVVRTARRVAGAKSACAPTAGA